MSSETILENSDATVKENDSNATVRERSDSGSSGRSITADTYFRNYKIIRELPTKSTEADIFVVSKDGIEYILKKYRKGFDPKQEILQAIKVLSENYPDNFIRVFESAFDKNSKRYYKIQEYAQKGTLSDIIESSKGYTDTERATLFTNVATQVGEALYNFHENDFIHRDVKPSNILVRSLDPLNLVVIDFGIASTLEAGMSKKATQFGGTPMYQSPESFSSVVDEKTGKRRVILGSPTDWWGLGMILLEIAAGFHPFRDLSADVIAYSIATETITIPEKIDAGQKELLKGLLTRNPEKR